MEKNARKPKCARCSYHIQNPPNVKGHKSDCPYKECICTNCSRNDKRKTYNKIVFMARKKFNPHLKNDQFNELKRNPRCGNCENHQTDPPIKKGHKRNCPFRKEVHTCDACGALDELRKLSKETIEVRRTMDLNQFTYIDPVLPKDHEHKIEKSEVKIETKNVKSEFENINSGQTSIKNMEQKIKRSEPSQTKPNSLTNFEPGSTPQLMLNQINPSVSYSVIKFGEERQYLPLNYYVQHSRFLFLNFEQDQSQHFWRPFEEKPHCPTIF